MSKTKDDSVCELFEKVIGAVNNKKDKEKGNDNLLVKQAKVIGYDGETYKAFIYFIDDLKQTSYTLYNKSGELLSEGDNVKVYYTTNPAKGWIGAKMGNPNITTVKAPYISKKITNAENITIDSINRPAISVDFRVDGTDSDVVFDANQFCAVNNDGVFNYTYKVDGETQDFKPSQNILQGNQLISHLYPMVLPKGKHNISIYMNAEGCKGSTSPNYFIGVISGQISDVQIIEAPSENLMFKIKLATPTTIVLPQIAKSDGNMEIDWGDNSEIETHAVRDYPSHEYTSEGDYTITIKISDKEFTFGSGTGVNVDDYLKAMYLPVDALKCGGAGNAILNNSPIESLKLGDSLTDFGMQLNNCKNITSILFPDTLKTINSNLQGTSLTKLVIPKNVESISDLLCYGIKTLKIAEIYGKLVGKRMFLQSGLEKVTIGDNVESIVEQAFSNNSSLNTVVINPDKSKLATIGNNAFHQDSLLEKFNFPKQLTSIGINAFNGTGLKTVITPKSLQSIGQAAFMNCTKLTDVTLAEGLLSIDTSAFENTNISKITIPSTVNNLKGNRHFKDNLKLERIEIKSPNIHTIPASFAQGSGLNAENKFHAIVFVSAAGINYVNDYAFFNSSLYSFDFSHITEIGNYAFSGGCHLTGVTDVELPLSTKKIGMEAFSKSSITGLVIPESVEMIGAGIVKNCEQLASIDYEAKVNIPNNMAEGCTSLSRVKIGADIEEIGINAFKGCYNLVALNGSGEVTSGIDLNAIKHIHSNAFYGAFWQDYSNLTIPPPVNIKLQRGCKVDNSAFASTTINSFEAENCTFGVNVLANSSVRTAKLKEMSIIPASTFQNCKDLKTVEIEKAITIGENAFNGCTNLRDLNANNVLHFREGCFRDCKRIKYDKLKFNPGCDIGANAFFGSGLDSFHFENVRQNSTKTDYAGVFAIGALAFAGSQIETVDGRMYLWNVDAYETYTDTTTGKTVTVYRGQVGRGIYNKYGITVDSIFANTKMMTASDYARLYGKEGYFYVDNKTPDNEQEE